MQQTRERKQQYPTSASPNSGVTTLSCCRCLWGMLRLCTAHPGSYSRRCIKDDVPTRSILCSFGAYLLTHPWVLARSQRENMGLNLSVAGKKPKSISLALNGRGWACSTMLKEQVTCKLTLSSVVVTSSTKRYLPSVQHYLTRISIWCF